MRPTEEKRQQTIKTYLKLLRELKRKREIHRIVKLIKSYGLHNSVSSTILNMGIIDRYGRVCYWIYTGDVDLKLAAKVYHEVNRVRTKAVVKSLIKTQNYKPKEEKYTMKYKRRYDFAKMHGFGEHSPISKMIKELGEGNYTYGLRLFERKFREFAKS